MAVETAGPPGGNALPDLNKHGAFNETPVPMYRPRTEPSRAMTDSPQKYLLPAGAELRDIIRRRLQSQPMSAPALWASLNQSYQTRPRQEQAVIDAVAGMLSDGELEQRDGKLHVAEPPGGPAEPAVAEIPEIDPVLWTMTHTARVLHVLGAEPQTREALARKTGLEPRQVSKAAYLLIQQGHVEVAGDVPRTWRRVLPAGTVIRADPPEPIRWQPEREMLTGNQTRDVLLERVSGVCDTDVVVADVMRLSGWAEADVRRLIDDLGTEGELIGLEGAVHKPLVKSEQPPTYEIGDEDDGEIPEPGVGRPIVQYAPESAVLTFVERDGERIIAEHSITIDEDGLCFDGAVLTFAGIDAAMPVLRRVHRALFGGDDGQS